jgi:hypothetical protein
MPRRVEDEDDGERRRAACAGGPSEVRGAHANGKQCHISKIAAIEDAFVSALVEPRSPSLRSPTARCSPQGFGGFWQRSLVAEEVLEVATQQRAWIWDYPAPTLLERRFVLRDLRTDSSTTRS